MLRIDPSKHKSTYLLILVGLKIGEFVAMRLKNHYRMRRPAQEYLCQSQSPCSKIKAHCEREFTDLQQLGWYRSTLVLDGSNRSMPVSE